MKRKEEQGYTPPSSKWKFWGGWSKALFLFSSALLLAGCKIEAAETQPLQPANQLPSNPDPQATQNEQQTNDQIDFINSNPADKPLPKSEEPEFKDKATGDWGGLRKDLKERGLEFELVVMPEGFDNFRGGVHEGCVGALTTDLKTSVDMERAFCLEGGKFFLNLQGHSGRNPSTNLVGDLQGFDQYNAPPNLQIFEVWYQQKFCCDTLRFKIGKINANTEFSVIENSYYFFNNASQSSPTILAFPSWPHTHLGANIFISPSECWKTGFGVYAANRSDTFGLFGGDLLIFDPTSTGALMMGETAFFWKQDPLFLGDGNFKIGVWTHTGTFHKLQGGQQKGASGYYIVLNQTLWQPCEETETQRGIRSFLTFGQTEKSVSFINWSLSSGLTWTGFLKCRKEDVIGFAPSYAHISSDSGLPYSYELAWEGFYCWQFTDWGSLTADLQYIVHPGGQYSNALVGTLNLELHF